MRARSLRSAIGSDFITGKPNRLRNSVTRPGGSMPSNCSMSGLSASMIAVNASSLASTVSATLPARPCTRLPSARAASSARWRGLGGKNTKPTKAAPESSATSSACGVDRPQILTNRDIVGGVLPPSPSHRKAEPLRRRRRDLRQRRRLGPQRMAAIYIASALNVDFGLQAPHFGVEPADPAPPFSLTEPGGKTANQHADDEHHEDDDEQWQGRRIGGHSRRERIERHRHRLPVGDREGDDDRGQRDDDDRRDDFAEHR